MKFKGVLHPLIISPTRVEQLFEVTHTPEGRSSVGQAGQNLRLLVNMPVALQAFGSEQDAACLSCSLCCPVWFCSFQTRRRNSSEL